ncbi:MAG: hypothetical protein K6E20_05725 [Acholeplasmatales bacterium]|nr:hypothetical protein [Acholeplasmatales bacterium]
MNNLSRETSKENLKKYSSIFYKLLMVIKVFLIVFAVIFIVLGLTTFMLGVSDKISDIYRDHPKMFENIDFEKDDALMFVKNEVTVEEIYLSGDLDKLMYGYAVYYAAHAAIMVVSVCLCHYVQKIFKLISLSESPFDTKLLKPLKILFIILTIFSVIKSGLLGLLVGGILLCMYFMYMYGCKMQEDEDHTL